MTLHKRTDVEKNKNEQWLSSVWLLQFESPGVVNGGSLTAIMDWYYYVCCDKKAINAWGPF